MLLSGQLPSEHNALPISHLQIPYFAVDYSKMPCSFCTLWATREQWERTQVNVLAQFGRKVAEMLTRIGFFPTL